MEAFYSEREQLLTVVMGPALRDMGSGAGKMVDSRLNREYDVVEATVMAALTALYVGENLSLRPSIAEVLQIMGEKASLWISTIDSKSKGMPDL
ncbi:putative salt tolerance receptor-like cytoplasmic kinase 1 [Cocos nucifera]|uniref:Putative salt tolerance receptor-like cytoplasmic kinase 1 n=1 Tax=Cocos nucifera TaxID=13894 RepID=A0A8K0IMX5_COCNU|nr:putative salt tolerance receptor-like cytoplasmic kinase 1 [Cocos nucifera]